jgi:hypothetical protein
MKRRSNQRLFALAAVVAVIVGGTLAAVTIGRGASHESHGPLATASSYLGIPASQLRVELRSGKSLAQIANATSGKSSAGLVSALLAAGREKITKAQASLPTRVNALVNRVRVPAQRPVAASYLGLELGQLTSELRSGKTLAQIANATPGKSAAGLIDAIVAARKPALDARVAAGKLTQAKADARLAKLKSRVASAVNRSRVRG